LMEAYAKSSLDIPLVIAGGGSHSGDYEKDIRAQAEQINQTEGKHIVLTGFIQGRILEEIYSNALLYILPSEIEGMPLSLLEAMSYGNICLTSDIVENISVTEQYGYCFKNKKVADLCTALESVVKETQGCRKYTREEIQQFVLSKYNWDDVVKRTLECYESINGK